MDNSNARLRWLFYCFQHNICTPEERSEFLEMIAKEENYEEINCLLAEVINDAEADREMDPEKAEQLFAIISHNTKESKAVPAVIRKLFSWRKIAVAASIVFMAAVGLYLVFADSRQTEVAQLPQKNKLVTEVIPGHDNVTLTLADGTIIVLDSAANGALAEQGNMKIIKLDGQIKYAGEKGAGTDTYNTITTARGNQYQLELSDGSKVWLNAASSIRFPVSFMGKERRVSIQGEAYFEVAHHAAAPFKVDVNGMEITVLGTHFNVNAYSDEANIKTTLLEGSIKITKGKATGILKPGQQARLDENDRFQFASDVDTDKEVAWKNGTFIFNSEDIESIMRQISRWYDVEIIYQRKVGRETFSGIVSRQSNLSQVLRILEAGGMRFQIEGRKVIIL